MANSDDIDWLRRRLDAMIQLLLESAAGGALTSSSKIEKLMAMGFTQAEVAQIIGKKTNFVTATVASKKKIAARKKASKKASQPKQQASEPTSVAQEGAE